MCDCVLTFQSLKRKTKSQNGDAQSLLYLLSLAYSNADSRVSHANDIVGYYKKSTRRNGDRSNRRRVACICDVIQVFQTTIRSIDVLPEVMDNRDR